MSWYEKNLSAVIRYHPDLKETLNTAPSEDLVIVASQSGRPTGLLKERYIHSRFDPMGEAEKIIEREYQDNATIYIFYGFGLGYHVESFIRRFPDKPVMILESDPSLFLKALTSRDLDAVLTHPDLRLLIGLDPEGLPYELDDLPFSNPKTIKLRGICSENTGYYDKLDWILGSYKIRREINLNTLDRFGRLWVKNLARNIPHLLTTPGVIHLSNLFTGLPSIVLASGPSLDSVLPYLPELYKRFLVITVDTSLNACLNRGIEPDFLVIVDPQYWNTRHIDRAQPRQTFLVSESSSHPRIFRILDLPTFFVSSLFPLGEYLESQLGERGKLGAGGSVSTSAWDLARLVGTQPIYLAGLDLGFPEGQTHFKGAFFENRFYAHSRRIDPVEQMCYLYLTQANPFPVTSNSAAPVLTDQRMIIYKWWFENQMKINPGCDTRNLSGKGVRIDGIRAAEIKSLLGYPVIREKIEERKNRAREVFKSVNPAPLKQKMVKILEELIKDLQALKSLTENASSEISLLGPRIEKGPAVRNSLKRLNEIDKKILQAGSREVAGFLLQPIIHRILDEAGSKGIVNSGELIDTSRALYGEIEESAAFHIKLLQQALDQMHRQSV